jgi:NAD(P)-dependent dehydrogenase (short-subunit alcohol dehydrogenase family)
LSLPTYATKTLCGSWSIKRSLASVGSMQPSIPPALLSMKHELRVMLAQGSGSIINISSTYGHLGARGASVYSASKHAVEGLTKSAALEAAASGVRINAVAPGPIETAMLNRFTGSPERKAGLVAGVPLQRAGEPEEIANAIVFLASGKSSFTTGQVLFVDGGKSAT